MKTPLSLGSYFKIGTILLGGIAFIWFFSIRPHTHDWQLVGAERATIKTLMSNSNVIGSPEINAIVTLSNGRQAVVAVPMKADIRAGDHITVFVQQDAGKPSRKRYAFKSVAN